MRKQKFDLPAYSNNLILNFKYLNFESTITESLTAAKVPTVKCILKPFFNKEAPLLLLLFLKRWLLINYLEHLGIVKQLS